MTQAVDQDSWIFRITKGPSSVFAVLFAISCVLHIYQSRYVALCPLDLHSAMANNDTFHRKYHSWAYTWQLPFGSILATAAFICLEISAFRHDIDNASAVIGLFFTSA